MSQTDTEWEGVCSQATVSEMISEQTVFNTFKPKSGVTGFILDRGHYPLPFRDEDVPVKFDDTLPLALRVHLVNH